MAELVHEARCIEWQAKLAKFIELWPNFCHKCGSWGVITYDMIVSRGELIDPGGADPCGQCLEKGICPRCGDPNLNMLYREGSDWGYCHKCGWDEHAILERYGDWQGMIAPEGECECWMNHQRDLEEMELELREEELDLDLHMAQMIKHDPNPVMFENGAYWFMDELWIEKFGPFEYRSGAECALRWYAAHLEFKNGQQIFYGGDELGNPICQVSTKMYYSWERYSEPNAIFVGDDIDQGWDYSD